MDAVAAAREGLDVRDGPLGHDPRAVLLSASSRYAWLTEVLAPTAQPVRQRPREVQEAKSMPCGVGPQVSSTPSAAADARSQSSCAPWVGLGCTRKRRLASAYPGSRSRAQSTPVDAQAGCSKKAALGRSSTPA